MKVQFHSLKDTLSKNIKKGSYVLTRLVKYIRETNLIGLQFEQSQSDLNLLPGD